MKASGLTHIGRRSNNEDCFRILPELGLFVVADGMGGYAGGEIASRLVVDTLADFFTQNTSTSDADGTSVEDRMAQAIRMAHHEVQKEAKGRLREMGSTLAVVQAHEGTVLVAHVGDSRVYRIRKGHIEQLTRDHSLTSDLEAAGATSMLMHLPTHYRHMVTRCIASEANAEPDFRLLETQPGDTYVLCSDGVHDVLGGDAILDAVHNATCEQASAQVVARAFAEGTQDNITVVVVRF